MEALERWGWDERAAAAWREVERPDRRPGRVVRVHRISCDVVTPEGDEEALPVSELPGAEGASLPAAGDWVALRDAPAGADVLVEAVAPRWSAISRRDPADRAVEQVLAANVDVVAVVHGQDQEVNLARIERSLVLAHDSGATPVVVLSKADLAPDLDRVVTEVRAVALRAAVIATSCETGVGLDALAACARPNRTIALIGASGAGKSTLINHLVGEAVQETAAVRARDAKGRHTTSRRELVPIPGGGVLIDTPGLRGLGLWEAEEGIARAFADVEALAEHCRFRDCRHEAEPSCAVKDAVAQGRLAARRLDSYRRLRDELEDLQQRQTEQARRQRSPRRRRGPKR